MKIRNPRSRFDLNIRKSDRVLEVGGGHNPHPRSNVVVDKYVDDNTHRSGDIKILNKQQFLNADGEKLPFKDKEFDYVICNQVLEHVENPTAFLHEQFRVARRGYIETPSLLGEFLFPKASHKWVLLEINGELVLLDKKKMNFPSNFDFGYLFLEYLPKHSIGYKILERTHPNLHTMRLEWADDGFKFNINPEDPDILKYFESAWTHGMVQDYFPERSLGRELTDATKAFAAICKSVIKSKILKIK